MVFFFEVQMSVEKDINEIDFCYKKIEKIYVRENWHSLQTRPL